MNLVGKIFIVLIFVLSIIFMAFAVAVYAAHTNWRDLVKDPDNGLETQLKNEKVARDQLADTLAEKQKELGAETVAKQKQLALLETQKEVLTRERDRLNKEIAEERSEARDAIAALAAAHANLKTILDEVAELDQTLLDTGKQRDTALAGIVAKTDIANSLAMEKQTLQKQAAAASEQLANALEVLRKFNLKAEPARYQDTPTKGVTGRVEAVLAGGFVQIGLGEDDGLLVGHRLDVYRNSVYLGKVEVFRTRPDQAVCKVLPEFRKGNIQVNDNVSTGLQSK